MHSSNPETQTLASPNLLPFICPHIPSAAGTHIVLILLIPLVWKGSAALLSLDVCVGGWARHSAGTTGGPGHPLLKREPTHTCEGEMVGESVFDSIYKRRAFVRAVITRFGEGGRSGWLHEFCAVGPVLEPVCHFGSFTCCRSMMSLWSFSRSMVSLYITHTQVPSAPHLGLCTNNRACVGRNMLNWFFFLFMFVFYLNAATERSTESCTPNQNTCYSSENRW